MEGFRKVTRFAPTESTASQLKSASLRGRQHAAVVFLLAILLLANGCRVPAPPILSEPKFGLIYDTNYEHEVKAGKWKHSLVDGIWDPYFDTLAEPVAVKNWGQLTSTWSVFFATNRAPENDPSDGSRPAFENNVINEPVLGQASVMLPRRQRGQDPKRSRSGKLRLASFIGRKASEAESSGSENSNEPDAGVALVDNIQIGSDDAFFGPLNDQIQRSRQRDVLLFVHGFNVDFESSLIRAAQLGMDMPFNGAIVAYSWPTQGGVLNYEVDESVNAASVAPFAEFLARLRREIPSDAKLKIVVHSMGNRIVLKGIQELPIDADSVKPVSALCLCAPDVGRSDYESWIPEVIRRCERVVLYANESDGALILSNHMHLDQRTGDAATPAVFSGVELIDCSRVDLSFLGHSYFSGNPSVLADLFCVLKENTPPEARAHLKPELTSDGQKYWTFDSHPNRILWTWHFDETDAIQ